jgi:hypothetical protein
MRPVACIRTFFVVLLLLPIKVFGQDGYREIPRLPEYSGPDLPTQRLSVGVNYTGGQLRWRLSPRWAAEGRMQFGSADSDYGQVHSQVFGMRLYRFAPLYMWERASWYLAGEADYAKADTNNSSYSTKGFAAGAVGGVELRIAKRLSVDADIGPYVISLKETQTNLTSTGMDFVVNTALNFYLF